MKRWVIAGRNVRQVDIIQIDSGRVWYDEYLGTIYDRAFETEREALLVLYDTLYLEQRHIGDLIWKASNRIGQIDREGAHAKG